MSELQKYNLNKVDFHLVSFPVFSEVLNRYPFVFYGDNNLLPQYYIELYNSCAIHKAVVTSKKEQVCGDKMVSLDNPMSVVNTVNGKETIYEVFRKCTLDLILFGGYSLNIVWSRDRKTIAEIYHIDFSRIRSGKINPETDEIDCYYYCPDWRNIKKYPPTEYPTFNQNTKEPSQILYYKCYQPSNSYYPAPDWSGGQRAIETDVEIKNFHMNNLRKGMTPSLFISMNNGIPSEEEQRQITRALESQYSGSDNAGQAIISFNESKELSPEITMINRNESDNYYQAIYDDIVRSILSAHRVSSAELFGIATSGKLGGSDEIVQHSEFFRNTVIKPYQQELLPVFNKLMSMKLGQPVTLEIVPLTILNIEKQQQGTVQNTQ